jgi:hypothetical protein
MKAVADLRLSLTKHRHYAGFVSNIIKIQHCFCWVGYASYLVFVLCLLFINWQHDLINIWRMTQIISYSLLKREDSYFCIYGKNQFVFYSWKSSQRQIFLFKYTPYL